MQKRKIWNGYTHQGVLQGRLKLTCGTPFLCVPSMALILLQLSRIIDNNSYHDFLIIPTISGKADKYRLLLKKGRDNFFKKGRYLIAGYRCFDAKRSG